MGIDPGTATTGYGVVEATEAGLRAVAFGVIRTPAEWSLAERMRSLHEQLSVIIALHGPTTAAVEKLFFQKNVRSAMAVGQARGVTLLALAERGLAVGEYSPLEVKQAVTGYGGAGKRQVQQMVRTILALDDIPRPDDAADALAIAICHLHCARMKDLVEAS